MSFLDVPVITQEQYDKLYSESDVMESGILICSLIFIHRILNKFLIRSRKCAYFNKYDKYDTYDEYGSDFKNNEVYNEVFLGSFNMDYFIKEKKEKPFYLKVNFSFADTNIESFKENLKKDYVNTSEFIQVIVNPKLVLSLQYKYESYNKERLLSTAHVLKTSEEDTYDHIKHINDFFEKTTGETLFFRF